MKSSLEKEYKELAPYADELEKVICDFIVKQPRDVQEVGASLICMAFVKMLKPISKEYFESLHKSFYECIEFYNNIKEK